MTFSLPEALILDTQPRATAPSSGPHPDGGAFPPLTIVLDMPMPPSTNRIWRIGGRRIHKSKDYTDWLNAADMYVLSTRQYPKHKIHGPFRCVIALNRTMTNGDGDNRIKAVLDWCQSREIIRNDSDCQWGSWAWVDAEEAPEGCRLTLWSLPE
jgi:Holliday junction resolvase RusA-like endonuclease